METDEQQVQQALALRDELIVAVKPIKTDEDRLALTTARQNVKGWLDNFKGVEAAICDPIYKAWKNAKNRFAEGRAPAEKFLESLDGELRADRTRQLAAQAREQQRQNDLAQKRIERAQASGRARIWSHGREFRAAPPRRARRGSRRRRQFRLWGSVS